MGMTNLYIRFYAYANLQICSRNWKRLISLQAPTYAQADQETRLPFGLADD